MSKSQTSKIRISVKLNEDNIPVDIRWHASNSRQKEEKKAKSMMLYLWDYEEKNTMNVNLWTKEMQVDEMYVHFFQNLMIMADTLQKATGNQFAIQEMKAFCSKFDARVKAEAAEAQQQQS